VALARKVSLPSRKEAGYAESLRALHSAILGLCALIESFPYSVEPWMPGLTEGGYFGVSGNKSAVNKIL
jgi:proteasome activator subunit 4